MILFCKKNIGLNRQNVGHFWDQRGFPRATFRRAREIAKGQAKSFCGHFFKRNKRSEDWRKRQIFQGIVIARFAFVIRGTWPREKTYMNFRNIFFFRNSTFGEKKRILTEFYEKRLSCRRKVVVEIEFGCCCRFATEIGSRVSQMQWARLFFASVFDAIYFYFIIKLYKNSLFRKMKKNVVRSYGF